MSYHKRIAAEEKKAACRAVVKAALDAYFAKYDFDDSKRVWMQLSDILCFIGYRPLNVRNRPDLDGCIRDGLKKAGLKPHLTQIENCARKLLDEKSVPFKLEHTSEKGHLMRSVWCFPTSFMERSK